MNSDIILFKVGEKYTYPEICRRKGEDIKKGTSSKKAHISSWCVYETWKQSDRKLEYCGEKTEEEQARNRLMTTYNKLIELYVYSFLKRGSNGVLTTTIPKLARSLSFVNSNFAYGQYQSDEIIELVRDNKLKVVDEEHITSTDIELFTNRVMPNFKKTIETALKHMVASDLISYNKVLHLGIKKNGHIDIRRRATHRENQIMLECGRKILDSFGLRECIDPEDKTVKMVKADKWNLTRGENAYYFNTIRLEYIKYLNGIKSESDTQEEKEEKYMLRQHRMSSGEKFMYYFYEYEIILNNKGLLDIGNYNLDDIRRTLNEKVMNKMEKTNSMIKSGLEKNHYYTWRTLIFWFINSETVDIKQLLEERKTKSANRTL